MRNRTRTKFVIDPAQPIALLDVDNDLDNGVYKWCADEITDETGRYLRDDELTYDQFAYGPEYILPAGTTVRMDYLWGYSEDGMTDVVDYEITIPRAASLKYVVKVILSVYHGQMQEKPDGSGRFYFIEGIAVDEDGVFNVHFGT